MLSLEKIFRKRLRHSVMHENLITVKRQVNGSYGLIRYSDASSTSRALSFDVRRRLTKCLRSSLSAGNIFLPFCLTSFFFRLLHQQNLTFSNSFINKFAFRLKKTFISPLARSFASLIRRRQIHFHLFPLLSRAFPTVSRGNTLCAEK